ncbi:hypothetical protein F5887DRAFT_1085230 [Amanita rubescens]|nr:hypothetical protein F5887DRAFT_1085230 [Amanita rubescens]
MPRACDNAPAASTDQQDDLGPRRAKVDALNNAVWKQSGRKRQASPAAKAVQKRKKSKSSKRVEKENVPNDLETDKEDFVSIHVPAARKKRSRPIKTGRSQSSKGNNQKVAKDPSIDEGSESSATEPDVSTEPGESETESDASWIEIDSDSDNGDVDDDKKTVTKNRYANEKPILSDNGVDKPSASTRKSFIRRAAIEIPDDDDEVDSSLLVVKKEPLQSSNVLNTKHWPWYTDIVKGPKGDLSLNFQMYELRLIVRKAIRLLEEKVRFEHGFPSAIQRDGWGRTCLQKACENIREWSDGEVKYRYKMFHERFTADDEYVGEISTLLDPRISLLRGATKAAAVINTRNAYDLGKGNTQQLIQELLQSKCYIYPPTPNGLGYQREKPFEHNAIIGTLRDDLFGGANTIIHLFPDHFKLGEQASYALTPAMVALAATAVYAAIREWETGRYVSTHFSANIFADIYRNHVTHLLEIQAKNRPAYESLMRRLFRLASNTGFGPEVVHSSITDIENMPVDV